MLNTLSIKANENKDYLLSDKFASALFDIKSINEKTELESKIKNLDELQKKHSMVQTKIEKNHESYAQNLFIVESFFKWFFENTISKSLRSPAYLREKELYPFLGTSLVEVMKLPFEERIESYSRMLEQLERLALLRMEPETPDYFTTGKYIKRGKFHDFTVKVKESNEVSNTINRLIELDKSFNKLDSELIDISKELSGYFFLSDDKKNMINIVNNIFT
ncbi:hypothetical protein [Pseudoalteromonas sp. P1-8]|uniref:hypothetical protein n=1 Tax=Pseudoalteromonas sp. P1-8 TaxID=1710353 RepID=UPI001364C7EC|nr:hypothetical protein [Pseudoalteromonas sp. P1-8]